MSSDKSMYITLVSIAVSIVLYWTILQKLYGNGNISNKDVLNKQVFKAPILGKNCCSWWPLSHFITFTIWGFIWPHLGWQMFALGVLWECIEYYINVMLTPKDKDLTFKKTRTQDGTLEYEQWWSSSSKDILFNAAGILTGIYLKKCTCK